MADEADEEIKVGDKVKYNNGQKSGVVVGVSKRNNEPNKTSFTIRPDTMTENILDRTADKIRKV